MSFYSSYFIYLSQHLPNFLSIHSWRVFFVSVNPHWPFHWIQFSTTLCFLFVSSPFAGECKEKIVFCKRLIYKRTFIRWKHIGLRIIISDFCTLKDWVHNVCFSPLANFTSIVSLVRSLSLTRLLLRRSLRDLGQCHELCYIFTRAM